MSQKHVVIIFVILILVGIGTVIISNAKSTIEKKLQVTNTAKITPTKTPEEVIFSQNAQSTQTQQVMNKKQIKQYPQFPGELSSADIENKEAVIETNKGVIEMEIYPEATKSASNFIFLAEDKFYDGLTFHRVEPGFVIQGGDPLGNGRGGPGYQFADDPVTRKYDRGIVAMANSGPNTNGSQFFIMLADNSSLPPQYSIFGKVVSGMDIVDKIKVGDIMNKISIIDRR
ncbi:MAG: peptidylprolyl isomerase [Candidatus Daviesbacteria bacterium]|nr:peptidylprolyl isomerase [Candidatus Daviesbacteria bacterium]